MPGPTSTPASTVGSTAHNPTAAQLAQLATYKATLTSANATLATATTTYNSAQVAQQNAAKAYNDYHHYIYGGTKKSANVLDEGTGDVV